MYFWQLRLTSSVLLVSRQRLDKLSDFFLSLTDWSAMYSGLAGRGNHFTAPAVASSELSTVFVVEVILLIDFFLFWSSPLLLCSTRSRLPRQEFTNICASWDNHSHVIFCWIKSFIFFEIAVKVSALYLVSQIVCFCSIDAANKISFSQFLSSLATTVDSTYLGEYQFKHFSIINENNPPSDLDVCLILQSSWSPREVLPPDSHFSHSSRLSWTMIRMMETLLRRNTTAALSCLSQLHLNIDWWW